MMEPMLDRLKMAGTGPTWGRESPYPRVDRCGGGLHKSGQNSNPQPSLRMSSPSSSSEVSLDSADAALCTPLLLETKEDAQAHAITAFFNLPTRILIGTKKLDFPVSPAHMMYNCALWQKAVEGGDEPKALLTETCIEPTDIEFQRAWMKANGFDDGKGPLGESGERYLDYLGYKTTSTTKLAGDVRRAMSEMAKMYEERKGVFDGEEDAVKLIKAYTAHLQRSNVTFFEYKSTNVPSKSLDLLRSKGFHVKQTPVDVEMTWNPPQRNAATKRPRPE